MELSLYLEQLYHNKIEVQKTNLGLTNTIYRAKINDIECAIRVPNEDISGLIGLKERHILDLIQDTNLDVEEIYYDNNTRIRITKWVDCLDFKQTQDKDKYIRATQLIKKLHSYKFKVDYYFDAIKMYNNFIQNIKQPLFNYSDYQYIIEAYNNINQEMILCHNDLVSGNILFSNDKDYLIDYEYAGMNYPIFDLMSFISENNIDDNTIRELIYRTYFERDIDEKTYQELHIVENMQNLLWAAWANMLYESRKEEIYYIIFKDKIKHLLKGI